MDATQIVDLVHEPKPLAWRGGVDRVVVGTAHVDALGGAHTGAEFAADALLHAVFVTIQHMATVKALGLGCLFVADKSLRHTLFVDTPTRILLGDALSTKQTMLLDGHEESVEISH